MRAPCAPTSKTSTSGVPPDHPVLPVILLVATVAQPRPEYLSACRYERGELLAGGATMAAFGAPLIEGGVLGLVSSVVLLVLEGTGRIDVGAGTVVASFLPSITFTAVGGVLLARGRDRLRDAARVDCGSPAPAILRPPASTPETKRAPVSLVPGPIATEPLEPSPPEPPARRPVVPRPP